MDAFSPLAGGPLGGSGGPSDDGVRTLSESIGVATVSGAALISLLRERIRVSGSPLGRMDLHTQATDGIVFDLALATGWQVMLDEGIGFAADAAGNMNRLAALVDGLHMSGQVTTRLDALVIVSTVLAMNALVATGWKAEAMDTVAFQDALAAQLNAMGKLVEGLSIGATPTPTLRLTAIASETLAIGDDPAATLDLYARLSEEVLFYTTLRLGDDEYVGWVLNEGAPSEYQHYPFNGMTAALGSYYGTASDGLYELVGEDDDGEPIDAFLRTAFMDFGTGKAKRLPEVYIAFAGGDKLVLKVTIKDDNGGQQTHIYTQAVRPGTVIHNDRIKIGRGLKACMWQFELANTDGDALELDSLKFHPLTLDRRLGG